MLRVVTFKLARWVVDMLDSFAAVRGVSRSDLIREAVTEILREPPLRFHHDYKLLTKDARIVTVKMPETMVEDIDRLRAKYRAYRSEIIREAVWRWLEKRLPLQQYSISYITVD